MRDLRIKIGVLQIGLQVPPNVCLEDDNATNIEAKISRSRRIKCSFVDLKELHLFVMRKVIVGACMLLAPSGLLKDDGMWKSLSYHALYMLPLSYHMKAQVIITGATHLQL